MKHPKKFKKSFSGKNHAEEWHLANKILRPTVLHIW
jgi:hypothetical protein